MAIPPWIKMRTNLWDDPRVSRLAKLLIARPNPVRVLSETCPTKVFVVGALYRTWALADSFTTDGVIKGYDETMLDEAIGIDGWSAALVAVEWLEITAQGAVIPSFEKHNGESAKKRAIDARRKAEERRSAAKTSPNNVQDKSEKTGTRRRRRGRITPTLPPSLNTPAFRTTLERFERFRSEGRNPLTALARARLIVRCERLGEVEAIEELLMKSMTCRE